MVRVLNAAPTVYIGDGGGMNGETGEADARSREMTFVPFRSRPWEL